MSIFSPAPNVASAGEAGGVLNELSLFFPAANTSGNTLIVAINQGDGQDSPPIALSCTDYHPSSQVSNTYTLAGSAGTPGAPRYTTLFYSMNCVEGVNQVTVTNYGASGLTMSMVIAEVPGLWVPDSGVLSEITGTGWDAAWETGSVTITSDTELLVGAITTAYGGLTVDSPFSVLGTNEDSFAAFYLDLTTIFPPATLSASGTLTPHYYGDWAAVLCGFKASA